MFLTTSIGKIRLDRIKTYHTNSILLQEYYLAENISNVSLDADYNFERKNHQSYKGATLILPELYLKHGSAKRLKHTSVKNRGERIKHRWVLTTFFSPAETKVIAAEIRRTQDIMEELETNFI